MNVYEALKWADTLGELSKSKDPAAVLSAEVKRLTLEVTALRLYAPARRAQPTVKTAPIAPPNLAFFGIAETDDEFAERAGRAIESKEVI